MKIFSSLASFGVHLTGKALALDFCLGYSQEFTSVIQEFNDMDEKVASLGKTMVQASILMGLFLINGMMFLYGCIFFHLYKTNKINKCGKLLQIILVKYLV